MSRTWSRGSTRRWRGIRAYVLTRDQFLCRAHPEGWCAKANRSTQHTCTVRAEMTGEHAGHAHHTRGKRFGDDPAYIVAACAACNLYIGDPEKGPDPRPEPRTRW